jgi:glycine cleavage system P protein (glycine dehydrogenase) subunit 2
VNPGRVNPGAPVRSQGPPEAGTLRDLSRPGRSAWSFPPLDVEPVESASEHRRRDTVGLPEVAERDLVRHFTRLSQMNYGVDTGIYPLGSCSMKYNPKLAETAASMAGFASLHPLQPDRTAQGAV